jgi:F0F1-type ATP synthase membrane subunit b/b'
MILKQIVTFLSLFIAQNSFAYEEAFRIEDNFPVGTVIAQVANLTILIAILYFSQRKSIQAVFIEKKETFLNNVKAASASKSKAEEKLKEVSDRLNNLKSTFETQLKDAEGHAQDNHRDQLATAKNDAMKMQANSNTNLEFEIQKQAEALRLETFAKSALIAEQSIIKNLTPEQLKSWNDHFVTSNQGAH